MDKQSWVRVAEIPLKVDLARLHGYLDQEGVAHRLSEENGKQVLWVRDKALVPKVETLLEAVLEGRVSIELQSTTQGKGTKRSALDGLLLSVNRFPVTLGLLLLSVLGALVVEYDYHGKLLYWLLAQPSFISEGRLEFGSMLESVLGGQFWRLITPIFLHFDLFHIVFNSLWLWEFGRRIECLRGHPGLLSLVLVSGILSNIAQYWWEGASIFGGMSGVIYALLGYIWWRHRIAPNPILAIPSGLIGFMIFWLVFCMTGIVDNFIYGKIANAAHLAGLLVGIVWGLLEGLVVKKQ